MTSPITAATCQAWWLLEAADLRNLPAPYSVDVTDYTAPRLGLRTVDELDRWAEALDVDVTSRDINGRTHWNAEGSLLDLPVSLFVVAASAAVAEVSA